MRGASLIEMMIVVVILSLMAALAAPNLFPLVKKTKLAGDTEAVASFVFAVRARAVAEGRCTRVRVVGTSTLAADVRTTGDCVNLDAAHTGDWRPSGLTMVAESGILYRLNPVLDALSASPDADLIVFRPNGRLWGDGDLDVKDDRVRILVSSAELGEVRSVVVNGTGRVCAISHLLVEPPMLPASSQNDCDKAL